MPSYVLQLDLGNTQGKWRLLGDTSVVARGVFSLDALPDFAGELSGLPAIEQCWVSSVAGTRANERLGECLRGALAITPHFAVAAAQFGDLVNSYSEPARMGVDRWLAMIAARERTQQRCCVVDAGSALTIDWIAENGEHEGGFIIPGAALMERALLLDTDRVRFQEAAEYRLSPGVETSEAVRHGIALALAGAVQLSLDRQGFDVASCELFYTGGAGLLLADLVGRGGDVCGDLVFEGLSRISH
ncbi:type III pantothenate kinase [Halioglobus pacificus]|uniref:Type III pantothenate kinase n=1 Tax=Parahalioglobus pacificus TaxID=930806 RepID=A0A919CNM9_9GAMM|nr:type III pantothenate kinase [Halioglobus pacificus]GHD39249.1 type III pantothenate kinase [Halioglobus pacificus]